MNMSLISCIHGHKPPHRVQGFMTSIFSTKRMLCQLARRASLNKFSLVCSPPGVIDAKDPFQRIEFKWTQVFFSLITLSADLLLFHMTLFDRARPVPCQLLKLEQILCQQRLQ